MKLATIVQPAVALVFSAGIASAEYSAYDRAIDAGEIAQTTGKGAYMSTQGSISGPNGVFSPSGSVHETVFVNDETAAGFEPGDR